MLSSPSPKRRAFVGNANLHQVDRFAAHSLERDVYRVLMTFPGLPFSELVVRRIPHGVCLDGMLEADDDHSDAEIASTVCGLCKVQNVLNRIVIHHSAASGVANWVSANDSD